MDLQTYIDGLSAQWARERSNEMYTLGKLIDELEDLNFGMPIVFDFDESMHPNDLMSYRGYYCDLAMDYSEAPKTVGELWNQCKEAMGQVFEGYKGGDFMMGATTPIWVSEYGRSENTAIEALEEQDDRVVIKTYHRED